MDVKNNCNAYLHQIKFFLNGVEELKNEMHNEYRNKKISYRTSFEASIRIGVVKRIYIDEYFDIYFIINTPNDIEYYIPLNQIISVVDKTQ